MKIIIESKKEQDVRSWRDGKFYSLLLSLFCCNGSKPIPNLFKWLLKLDYCLLNVSLPFSKLCLLGPIFNFNLKQIDRRFKNKK